MSKAYWIGLGILTLVLVGTVFLVLFSLFSGVVGAIRETRNLQKSLIETLKEYDENIVNTDYGRYVIRYLNQGFSIIYILYGLLALVLFMVLMVFTIEIIIWYASKRY